MENEKLQQILDAIYIEDCHISGTHDPNHTAKYVCRHQLADLAERVLAVSHGVKFATGNDDTPTDEINKIPRKITSGWHGYYKERDEYAHKAKELEDWEKDGFS